MLVSCEEDAGVFQGRYSCLSTVHESLCHVAGWCLLLMSCATRSLARDSSSCLRSCLCLMSSASERLGPRLPASAEC